MVKPQISEEILRLRLEKVERGVRRWRWACGGLLLITLVVVVEGTDWIRTTRKVVAHELVLHDNQGRVRAKMSADQPGLVLLDAKGREHIRLQARPDGSARLSLLDAGVTRAEMSTLPDGSARLGVYDDEHMLAAGLQVSPEGYGLVTLGGKPFDGSDTSSAQPGRVRVVSHETMPIESGASNDLDSDVAPSSWFGSARASAGLVPHSLEPGSQEGY